MLLQGVREGDSELTLGPSEYLPSLILALLPSPSLVAHALPITNTCQGYLQVL